MIELFSDSHIILITGDVWGHRKDINEWAKVRIERTVLEEALKKFAE
jgi:hypothetical protein